MTEKIKVLVVDDTITYRQILSTVVSNLNNVELSGTAPNGKIALSKIELNPPDLVLLDVSMPVLDGIETLKIIRKDHPQIDVIMVSGVDRGNANLTMKALNLGALDFIPKPEGTSPDESLNTLRQAINPLISLVRTRMFSRKIRGVSSGKETISSKADTFQPVSGIEKRPQIPEFSPERKKEIGKIDVVALGVSTGGPNALQVVIPSIEKKLPVPILAVQHMPPMFTASLAERLDRDSEIDVTECKEGEKVEKGHMYIAPGGHHMVVRKGVGANKTLGIVDSPPVNSCRPSVDVLFRSIGMVYGGNVLTVILTGMGNDGASGVATIRRKGGYSLVQDQKSSVVWGMPGAVVEAQAADEVVPLDRIANKIMEIVNKGAH
jgi:two-component system chemotaxis response regulator CheB